MEIERREYEFFQFSKEFPIMLKSEIMHVLMSAWDEKCLVAVSLVESWKVACGSGILKGKKFNVENGGTFVPNQKKDTFEKN